jgi:GTPase Era involved in 16S rRNA processing
MNTLLTVAVIVDAADKWTRDCLDKKVLQVLQIHKDTPSILVLNKVSLTKTSTSTWTIPCYTAVFALTHMSKARDK